MDSAVLICGVSFDWRSRQGHLQPTGCKRWPKEPTPTGNVLEKDTRHAQPTNECADSFAWSYRRPIELEQSFQAVQVTTLIQGNISVMISLAIQAQWCLWWFGDLIITTAASHATSGTNDFEFRMHGDRPWRRCMCHWEHSKTADDQHNLCAQKHACEKMSTLKSIKTILLTYPDFPHIHFFSVTCLSASGGSLLPMPLTPNVRHVISDVACKSVHPQMQTPLARLMDGFCSPCKMIFCKTNRLFSIPSFVVLETPSSMTTITDIYTVPISGNSCPCCLILKSCVWSIPVEDTEFCSIHNIIGWLSLYPRPDSVQFIGKNCWSFSVQSFVFTALSPFKCLSNAHLISRHVGWVFWDW